MLFSGLVGMLNTFCLRVGTAMRARFLLAEEEEVPLIKELWDYFMEHYFSVNTGDYENINLGTGTLITLQQIVIGLFIGVIIAAAFASFDKNHLGDFVRKLVHEDCLWKEKAKTLAELGFAKSPAVRGSLKRQSGILAKIVHSVEKDAHDADMEAARQSYIEKTGSEEGFVPAPFKLDLDTAHFYIPDEEHYAAEVRFEKKGSGWRAFLLVLIVAVLGAALVCWLLPDMLQLLDNMISILKGDGNLVN